MPFGDTFKALSDPTRRDILDLLKGGRLRGRSESIFR